MKVFKIVLTGGPCAGKTTMMNRIVSEFSEKGFKVLVCPEGATELIPNGIVPNCDGISMEDYQYLIIQKQLDKEALYDRIVKMMNHEKVIIMYDRGLMDGQSYVTPDFFQKVLDASNLDRSEIMGRYDAVIHLTTAARGGSNMYSLENNTARSESITEAITLDSKVLNSWVGHPHLRVIENAEDFEDKIQNALKEVYHVVGEPAPLEIENKYLVKLPDLNMLLEYGAIATEIVQTYLNGNDGVERRVRRQNIVGSKGYIYSYTKKYKNDICADSSNVRVEQERKITKREYELHFRDMNSSLRQIVKTRYCFVYKGQYFELDVFPGEKEAILEIELTDEKQLVDIPDFIEVIENVTGNIRYTNHEIAKRKSL